MGWTGTHREPGVTDREFMEQELPETLTRYGRILDCATVGNVFYAAVQGHYKHPDETWALIVLIQRSRDYFNITYKELTDTMGPAEDRCPARILDLLSPTENEYALHWRNRCRENAAKRDRAKQVRPGMTVRFAQPLEFTDGTTADTFTFEQRSTFRADGIRYRIRNWREMEWTVA